MDPDDRLVQDVLKEKYNTLKQYVKENPKEAKGKVVKFLDDILYSTLACVSVIHGMYIGLGMSVWSDLNNYDFKQSIHYMTERPEDVIGITYSMTEEDVQDLQKSVNKNLEKNFPNFYYPKSE
ncbi:hypothetical protein KY334_01915 [Candidatus Woesearchaeota archaeon]|nr:hypothetical protein [Candidatus Woesearchaeota archaeon]